MASVHRGAVRPQPPRGTSHSRSRQLRTTPTKATSRAAIRRALITRQLNSDTPIGGPVTAKNTQQPDQPGRRRLTRYLRALFPYFRTQPQSTGLSGKADLAKDVCSEVCRWAVRELMTLLQSFIS